MHPEVAAVCLQVSESTISRYIAKFRTTGNVNTKPIGRPVGSIAIHPYEELVILERILQTPETTLAEIAEEVSQETGSSYHCSTLHYYLKRNGFTLRKVCENKYFSERSHMFSCSKLNNCFLFVVPFLKLVKIAMQRREVARIDFRAITCHFPADMFVFVDESGFVSHHFCPPYLQYQDVL